MRAARYDLPVLQIVVPQRAALRVGVRRGDHGIVDRNLVELGHREGGVVVFDREGLHCEQSMKRRKEYVHIALRHAHSAARYIRKLVANPAPKYVSARPVGTKTS